MQALLICDDPDETAVLALALQRVGLTLATAQGIERAARMFAEQPPDALLIAVRSGRPADLVRRFRRDTEAPIVIVSSSSNEDVLGQALEAGADLVVSRPYSARLLILQLRALLRRTKNTALLSLPALSVGDLTLDISARTVTVAGRPAVRLTPLEFRLLHALAVHRGQTVPAAALIERVWGYEGEGNVELVRGIISRLRAKVEEDARDPRRILTAPGLGYMLASAE